MQCSAFVEFCAVPFYRGSAAAAREDLFVKYFRSYSAQACHRIVQEKQFYEFLKVLLQSGTQADKICNPVSSKCIFCVVGIFCRV